MTKNELRLNDDIMGNIELSQNDENINEGASMTGIEKYLTPTMERFLEKLF